MSSKYQTKPDYNLEQAKPLLDQTVALQSYMQDLLNESAWSETTPESESKPKSTLKSELGLASVVPESSYAAAQYNDQAQIESSHKLIPATGVKLQTLADLEAELVPVTYRSDEFDRAVSSVAANQENNTEEFLESPINTKKNKADAPLWAKNSFRALYARLGSLKLVMPLVQVQTVLKAKELVRVKGPLSAFMGYVQHARQRIPVLDLNALDGTLGNTEADDINTIGDGYVAIAEDHAVGLYFSEINDTHEVFSKAISWRCNDDSVIWIAGVDPKNLSIVVDFNRLCELL